MIRNLKALGLALVAMFALGAMAAASASAYEGKLTAAEPVTLDITESTPGSNQFTAFGSVVECTETVITGHKTEVTPHEPISSGDTGATLTFDLSNHCTADGHKATVTMNGCDFHFTITETDVPNTSYWVDYKLVCPAEKDIEVDVYTFAGSELGGIVCKITIKPNGWLTGGTLEDTGEHLKASGTVTGIHAERSGAGCAAETTNEGKFDVDATVTGTNAAKTSIPLNLSHP